MFGNISPWQLLIILLIVVVIFGTKKLRTMGGDLGGAVKSFRKAMGSEDEKEDPIQRLGPSSDESTTSASSEHKADSRR